MCSSTNVAHRTQQHPRNTTAKRNNTFMPHRCISLQTLSDKYFTLFPDKRNKRPWIEWRNIYCYIIDFSLGVPCSRLRQQDSTFRRYTLYTVYAAAHFHWDKDESVSSGIHTYIYYTSPRIHVFSLFKLRQKLITLNSSQPRLTMVITASIR